MAVHIELRFENGAGIERVVGFDGCDGKTREDDIFDRTGAAILIGTG